MYTELSGVPGPGYDYGRFISWTGKHLIASFIRLEIMTRCFSIKRLCQKIATLSEYDDGDACELFYDRNETKILRFLEDLVELSR